jgi:3-deoxy-D-manno-octulosonic-acid transferase
MRILYNLGILTYTFLARLLSPFNTKAGLWTAGRKDWQEKLMGAVDREKRYIWIHCASLGEFEQGRPIIEMLKSKRPELKVVLTFFSPSGYEVRRDYDGADYVCYLPPDTPQNAARFISLLNPEFVVFVKYEFWYNYLATLHRGKFAVYLVSAIFRPGQHFFRWYGLFFRRMLFMFRHIFVQDKQSVALLEKFGISNASYAGDTRFDRVVKIASSAVTIEKIERFRAGERILIAGSSWPEDEEIISRYINEDPARLKWIFAPHEIDTPHIDRLEKLINSKTVRYSRFNESSADARVMIIDNIGMLSGAYRYASVAVIGGGFGSGIHNILEAACWGIPVLFGPNHEKFREALDLLEEGGAKTFRTFEDFKKALDVWLDDNSAYKKSAESAAAYVSRNTGATARIFSNIFPEVINTDPE